MAENVNDKKNKPIVQQDRTGNKITFYPNGKGHRKGIDLSRSTKPLSPKGSEQKALQLHIRVKVTFIGKKKQT